MARVPAGTVTAALAHDLTALPDEVRESTEAAVARALAASIDAGVRPEACSRELRAVMASLRSRAVTLQPRPAAGPETEEGSRVADLAARIAARRGAASG